jgi:hypothetical protein
MDFMVSVRIRGRSLSTTCAVWLWAVGFSSAVLPACEPPALEETTLFERAEELYEVGDYDGASELYTRFLENHANSPLAEMAALRLRLVEREVDAVMGRRGSPAPLRVNPSGYGSNPVEAPVVPRFESPSLRGLGE